MHALLLHGAGGGGWEWTVWRRVFAAHGVAAHAPDLQPVADGLEATRFDDYLVQARAWAGALAQPRVLVGASLGGLLALRLASEVHAAALVLVNPLPPAPLSQRLAPRAWEARVPWQRTASLAGTMAALPDADAATWQAAWRRWRDESGAVLAEAGAGLAVERPACPVLLLASTADADVPCAVSTALAAELGADLLHCDGDSHVGPLLGRSAGLRARLVVSWTLQRGR